MDIQFSQWHTGGNCYICTKSIRFGAAKPAVATSKAEVFKFETVQTVVLEDNDPQADNRKVETLKRKAKKQIEESKQLRDVYVRHMDLEDNKTNTQERP